MPDLIKVIFKRVYVLDDADWFGSGEFYFQATVDGRPVGNVRRIFNAVERTWIDLPEAEWSTEMDVTDRISVVVAFRGKDQDSFSDDDLGEVRHTLRPPWHQEIRVAQTEYFRLEWKVELRVDGSFGRHSPDEIFACRRHRGSLACSTVSGARVVSRMEFNPVRPTPPALTLPPREPFPLGTGPAIENTGATNIIPTSPLNMVPNPSVIPILSPPDPGDGSAAPLAANAPPRATDQLAARVEFSYYRPDSLAFTDNDPRLEWTARALAGGAAVSFLGPARGRKVMVYGTTAGEILLELRFRGALYATYRALVMAVKQVPCRFNILNGPTAASQPRSTPADIQAHLAIANCYLRQIGLALVLDTNVTRTHNAVATTIPGIFRIAVTRGTTFRINDRVADLRPTRLNYRPNVMNFAYIHSEQNGNLGAASAFPNSNAAAPAGSPAGTRPVVTDNGTPSTSWVSPSGIPPDPAARTISMKLINGIARAGHPQLFSMYVTDSHGDPTQAVFQQNIANTIVHEFLHILNLGHRVEEADATQPTGLSADGIFWDGLNYPPHENIMHFNAPGSIAQDLDIIQARAAHQSPLVPP